jgi:hypothetical protein
MWSRMAHVDVSPHPSMSSNSTIFSAMFSCQGLKAPKCKQSILLISKFRHARKSSSNCHSVRRDCFLSSRCSRCSRLFVCKSPPPPRCLSPFIALSSFSSWQALPSPSSKFAHERRWRLLPATAQLSRMSFGIASRKRGKKTKRCASPPQPPPHVDPPESSTPRPTP